MSGTAEGSIGPAPTAARVAGRPALHIGLVNNMPDAAVDAAERQFTSLLQAAAGGHDVVVHLFETPGILRSGFMASRMHGRYLDVARIDSLQLDAVVVTGAEPRVEDLRDEAYWPSLVRLVETVATRSLPSLWSCLAAHAAVLALDGVGRRRLRSKRTGVFSWEQTGEDEDLIGLPLAGLSPHSRFNDLPAEALLAGGYSLLASSPDAGVEMFAKRVGGKFVFLQGHPEYDADSLLREYRRDLGRWARGEAGPPPIPAHYFSRRIEGRLRALNSSDRAALAEGQAALAASSRDMAAAPAWRSGALAIFGSFVRLSAAEKAKRLSGSQSAIARRA